MDWQELDRELEQGKIAPVYLFYGNESYLLERALKTLQEKLVPAEAAAFDYQELDGREMTAGKIVLLAATPPALAPRRLVVVKDPAAEILKAGEGDLLAYLENPAPTTCLVLAVNGSIDKRLKLVKLIQQTGRLVEFLPLKAAELEKWLQREAREQGYNLHPAAARALAQAGGGDLRLARNELYKVMTYTGQPGTITPADVEALVPAAAAEATIFQLVDALGNRNATLAINSLRRLLERGEAPLSILAMLARQVRLIYQYHLAADKRELAARLGVKPFVVQKVAGQARNFSLPAAARALEELLKVDTGIKTGQGGAGPLLEKAIWTIIKGEH
ncbi:DNA polymerase III subunit delta [Neomoorella mulderi]|uniref:DNA polymerase III subunit delta n=1 Tax=Moorella mulderi DSM 14980 TaxID=1122241 RepID=A0A151ATQ1_9FIRM|nr:DNA polymerase III subunit delta [Moorella mulderi]KYH31028.1 DNA polymerase III subunit delta [Moorella mulderi DSM 14980]